MESTHSFGRWIKRLRADRAITQDILAAQGGCSVETIRAVKTGRRRPSHAMTDRLASVLRVEEQQCAAFVRLARMDIGQTADQASGGLPVVVAPARMVSPHPPGQSHSRS